MKNTGKYAINWDNGHDCGTLAETYPTVRAAERAAREWKRGMVGIECTVADRRTARECYQWEVVETKEHPEIDMEDAPDNPRPEWF